MRDYEESQHADGMYLDTSASSSVKAFLLPSVHRLAECCTCCEQMTTSIDFTDRQATTLMPNPDVQGDAFIKG